MTAEATLLYVHGESIGYGRLGVELAKALTAAGVDVYDRIQETVDEPDPRSPKYLLEDEGERRQKQTNVACWVSTPSHARGWFDGQHVGIFTMFESTELPEGFREALHNFHTVVVPSDQNVELFSRYHPNVRKVQLGVDTARWCYRPRQEPTSEFRFLIGGSGKRKGTDLAVRAFRKVFPEGSWGDGPVPVLILKSPKPEDHYGNRLKRVGGRISAEEEVELYASAHCYLQPSRGEGFGLQPLQAIAQGCPTILTDAHGHKDFSWLGYGLSTTMEHSDYFIYGDAGDWWLPSLDDLCEYMLYVYHHYGDACTFAENAATYAAGHWGWDHTARQFTDAFDGQFDLPYSGDGSWVSPELKVFRTRVSKAWKADIAGTTYMFQPGVDYYEPADVKRIMYEAGVLDPECLGQATAGDTFDTGLTEAQADRLGAYRAEHAYCPTCGQQLGSGVTRADRIFEEMDREGRPAVTVASMFRDSVDYLDRYFAQVDGLREYMDVRLVLAEGDSVDGTYAALAARGCEIVKVDHGGDRYGSVDHPARWQNIAKVMRRLLGAVTDPGDAFIYVEPDLVWEPAVLARLVVDLEEVPAVAPLCLTSNDVRYYDVWGYRKDGAKFTSDPPYHPGLTGGLVPIDSCGSCFALRPDVFKRVLAEWDGVWPFHCADGLYVDTEARVNHP